ncbi:hypothetical protein AB0952_33105 [Streptomyces caniferus]|uniref:hypothetical protein n=1 Tax=Streptomyces caniferus TaxID=285557 RepID=UPI0034542C8D
MSDINDRLLALVDSVVDCDGQGLPLLTLHELRTPQLAKPEPERGTGRPTMPNHQLHSTTRTSGLPYDGVTLAGP